MVEKLSNSPEYPSHAAAAEAWIEAVRLAAAGLNTDTNQVDSNRPNPAPVGISSSYLIGRKYLDAITTGRMSGLPEKILIQPERQPQKPELPPVLLILAGRVPASSVEHWKKMFAEQDVSYSTLEISTTVISAPAGLKVGIQGYAISYGERVIEIPFTDPSIQGLAEASQGDVLSPLTALELSVIAPTLPKVAEMLGTDFSLPITIGASNLRSSHFSLAPKSLSNDSQLLQKHIVYNPNSLSFSELRIS